MYDFHTTISFTVLYYLRDEGRVKELQFDLLRQPGQISLSDTHVSISNSYLGLKSRVLNVIELARLDFPIFDLANCICEIETVIF